MKIDRQSKILEIIKDKEIETQEDLTDELKKAGFDVTQSTISRDIKELGLIKVLAHDGRYKYAAMDKDTTSPVDRLLRVFSEAILSIDYTGNLIVLKTLQGSAQVTAAAVDAMNWPGVLGTIAGDDTVLIIARNEKTVETLIRGFNDIRSR
ncbi:arginine repressor [Mahella sp.]|jgi:transcriptional regulator of arginine metabolism|uniref:arginine repressor n=1 Tax=Mahella sp. TaxID=2798721 RepID=UPI0025C25845|nr:arginine repressor [Mahella sp.]MBZ4666385.1 transcriptional regulator, ArgR family [Mahella sp.]MDK2903074.1 transcriptional regulator of arginine metabolism [Clostridiales bacterium]